MQQLTAQLSSQQQELGNTRAALEQQAQATSAALSVAQAAIIQLTSGSQAGESKRKPLNPKLAKAPESCLGPEVDWEWFKIQLHIIDCAADPEYPQLLKEAAMQAGEIDPIDMTDQAEGFCTDLFAVLVVLRQACEIPAMAYASACTQWV